MTDKDTDINRITINGTRISADFAIRFAPPESSSNVRAVMARPTDKRALIA